MDKGSGVALIVIGLLVLYLGITGRFKCFQAFFNCIATGDCGCGSTATTTPTTVLPQLNTSPNLNQLFDYKNLYRTPPFAGK